MATRESIHFTEAVNRILVATAMDNEEVRCLIDYPIGFSEGNFEFTASHWELHSNEDPMKKRLRKAGGERWIGRCLKNLEEFREKHHLHLVEFTRGDRDKTKSPSVMGMNLLGF